LQQLAIIMKIFFILIAFACCFQSFAQENNQDEFKRFGVGLGVGNSYYSYYENYPYNKDYSPNSDYNSFALMFNYHFSKHFNIGTKFLMNKSIRINDLAYNEFTKQRTKQKNVHSIYEFPIGFNFTFGHNRLRISTGLNTTSYHFSKLKNDLYVKDSNNIVLESHSNSKFNSRFFFIHPSLNLGIQYNFTPSIPFAIVNIKNEARIVLKPDLAFRFEADYQFCNLLVPDFFENSYFVTKFNFNFSLLYFFNFKKS